jgi:DNA-binding LacI/PurR family transcriptional regulator
MRNKVNCFDVAHMAGVSQATVSYVLTERKGKSISEQTRRKVLHAADVLGYQPNRAARSLASGRTGTIALWVPFAHYNVFSRVMEQFMGLARLNGWHVTIVQTCDETYHSLHRAGLISRANFDAILAHDATALVNEILDKHKDPPPIVSFGPAYSDRTDHVGVDLYDGFIQATRHLLSVGCNRVALVGVRDHLHEMDMRFRAYTGCVRSAGAEPVYIGMKGLDYESGYQAIYNYYQTNDQPDGLCCWNDEVAIGVMSALMDLGLRVPHDVAVVGSDGIREAAFCRPSLTTAAQPFKEICLLAWSFLQKRLDMPEGNIQGTVLPMCLEQRDSTNVDKTQGMEQL